MLPYIILIFSPIIIQHTRVQNTMRNPDRYRKKTEFSMKVFWTILLVLLVLRHETIGRDLPTYEYIFRYISKSNWVTALGRSPEIGWSFMNKCVSLLGGGFRWIIAISSVLSVVGIARAYIKYSNDTSLTISLFIITSNFVLLFSGLRQSIAISLGFLAFELVRKKKLIYFLFIVIIAMLFHSSAFMIIFMYPLYHLKLGRKHLVVIIPLLIAVFVFNKQIFNILGIILNQFTDYDTSITLTGSVTMLLLLVGFAIFSYLIPDELPLDADTEGMRNFLLLAVAIQMFAPLHNLAMRMNYYFIPFMPLLIPKIIEFRSARWSQVAIVSRYVMIGFFIVYFWISAPMDNVLYTFPYKFFWEAVY